MPKSCRGSSGFLSTENQIPAILQLDPCLEELEDTSLHCPDPTSEKNGGKSKDCCVSPWTRYRY